MADRSRTRKILALWYILVAKRKRRPESFAQHDDSSLLSVILLIRKRRIAFIQAILAILHQPRHRELWMRERSSTWFEMVEESYSDEQWYENFRMKRETVTFILSEISEDISRQDTSMRKAISAKRRLALTLYYLASTAEYRTIGNLFGVSVPFVCICIREVCQAIAERLSRIIVIPQGENLLQVMQTYEERWGFPMCAGAIDGTHLPILGPTESRTDYVNRKHFHSIIMQALVDCQYLFRDVVIGWPGSVHDARVLSNSALYRKGNANTLFSGDHTKQICGQDIPPVILGDPAYPLLSWLMKPYPENSNTPVIERVFNYRLSRARMTVENTFGRFKGRFVRFSKRVDMEVQTLVTVTTASCILHNICEVQNNDFLPQWEEHQASEQPMPVHAHNEVEERDAEDFRGAFAEFFQSPEGRLVDHI